MKHVWMLNHYAQEPGGSGGTRLFSLARHLPAHGWKVTIIAASTDHNTGAQRLRDDEPKAQQTFDGVPFLWLRASEYSGNGADRMRNMLDYTRAVLRPDNLAGLERPDVIIGSSVHPLAAWAGRKLARRYDVPFVFEVRDLWPQTLIDLGRISSRHPAAIAMRAMEKSLYRSASKIIALLPRAYDYIEPLGVAREKIVWIPNGVDLDQFPARRPKEPSDTFTLMYFGAHGAANGLDNIIQAMRLVSDHGRDDIVLRLIGDGPCKPSLKALTASLGLSNVAFENPVPKSRISEIAAEADAFVFNLIDAKVFKYGISSNKVFDFLAAERPILFCCGSSNNPIAEANAGLTVPPENPRALADAILRIASLPASRREEMGAAGRKHLRENYSMEILAKRLASTLDGCLPRDGAPSPYGKLHPAPQSGV